MSQDRGRQGRRSATSHQPGKTTALATRNEESLAIAQLISTPASTELEVVQRFNALAESGLVNLVTPVTAISKIPAWTTVSFAKVEIDPDDESGDVYFDRRFCDDRNGEVAMTKNAIIRLMNAAGIHKLRSYQADSEGDPYFCRWTCLLQWRDFSGRWLPKEISKTIDLRDGRPATMKPERVCYEHEVVNCQACPYNKRGAKKTGRQIPLDDTALAQARIHLHSNCETKALLRGVREFLALRQKYRKDDLKKPFIVPTLVPDLPMEDPQVKAAVLERELGQAGALYGQDDRARGIASAIVSHAESKRGPVAELRPPAADTIAPIQTINADTTPAPGDTRVLDADVVDAGGPVGPEPPPVGGKIREKSPAQKTDSQAETAAEAPAAAPGREQAEASDEMPPPLMDEKPEGCCSCPCDCSAVPPAGLAKKSQIRLETIRCADCYPDLGFDVERHVGLKSLEIPKVEGGGTVEQVVNWNKKRREQAARQADR